MKKKQFTTESERKQFMAACVQRFLDTGQDSSRQERFQLKYIQIAIGGGRRKMRETEARMAAHRPPALQLLVNGVRLALKRKAHAKREKA